LGHSGACATAPATDGDVTIEGAIAAACPEVGSWRSRRGSDNDRPRSTGERINAGEHAAATTAAAFSAAAVAASSDN
jgi:hypothetical protein